MNKIILDLGSDVNIFPNKTWELMGKPKMVWSPIQLRLASQYKIYPIDRLEYIEVNVDGVKTKTYFEVVEITNDIDPYPSLLGIDWAFDNLSIPNLKKRKMSFKSEDIRVIIPLDPNERECYFELVREDLNEVDLDNFYNVTT